ncbi:MAG: mechanosensitive ion channel family protein [Butyrivibrio sp.]|nr:mechanosensitive ion channel family protein [Butyrivibrio sp.]
MSQTNIRIMEGTDNERNNERSTMRTACKGLLPHMISVSLQYLQPQIYRAVIQVAQVIPQLEESETALREICGQMTSSWERISQDGFAESDDYFIPNTDEKMEMFISSTLSWIDRVTKLKVGRDGSVVVLTKEDMKVIAHSDPQSVGIVLVPEKELNESTVLDLSKVTSGSDIKDLNPEFMLFELNDYIQSDEESFDAFDAYMSQSLYGCILEYEDYYIICGVSLYERISFLINAAITTAILFIMIWLLVKWVSLVMNGRCESARSLRTKLFSYSLVICILTFCMSMYLQTLNNVANELKTMTHHAEVAVETLDTYKDQGDLLEDWMDTFYEIQCRLAAHFVEKNNGNENGRIPTRETMRLYADYLNVKYLYLFDKNGMVIATNSNYDHLKVGQNEGDFLYEFNPLLDGADCVILPPQKDGYGEYLQYIGVSIRNADDLCDGFVMVGVDPTLRDELLNAFTVKNVLNNLIIGLPDYAIAINKDDLTIVATTGLGYDGQNIEELGISKQNLEQNFSGFIKIKEQTYYAGVSSSKNYYLVPIMKKSGSIGAFSSSYMLVLYAAAVLLVISFIASFRYQKDVLDAYPGENKNPEDLKTAEVDDEENTRSAGILSGILDKTGHEKRGFEDRWNSDAMWHDSKTPEAQIMRIIYCILLLFCLCILLPTLYAGMNSTSKIGSMNNLTYVISGRWEKGFNIFAFTACFFLLCAMYAGSVVLDTVLYHIAKASSMRIETVCLLIRNAMKYAFVIIFVYYGLSQFGVNTQTLLASAGILSLMVGMGAKDMVGDILAGFFIIFESTYKVGDFISVGGWSGTVKEIGLRTTKIKRGTETKIFNNSSMRDIVNNDAVVRQVLKMPIAYEADVVEIEAVLTEELPRLNKEVIPGIVGTPKYEGIVSFEDSSILIQISMYVDGATKMPALRVLNRENDQYFSELFLRDYKAYDEKSSRSKIGLLLFAC